MAMFSALRKGVKQAKEVKMEQAEAKKKEDVKVPYRHVPTHAATDALTSSPPWREDDRPKIVEANRRRSVMAAAGHDGNPPIPKIASTLSNMSYPARDANPVVRLPRAVSYSGYPAMQQDHGNRRAMYMAMGDPSYAAAAASSTSLSRKGKEIDHMHRPMFRPPVVRGGSSLSLSLRGAHSMFDLREGDEPAGGDGVLADA